ncbi:hypothetical protein [Nocardia pseudovaccinii]|uniref:hypothetical protein n=1 Tax=Nocardia pseudovaccinii TaxID=189540 RepID=UPI000B1AB6C1|nr:hypothetical protein [Nocardia pseudovaccinii]
MNHGRSRDTADDGLRRESQWDNVIAALRAFPEHHNMSVFPPGASRATGCGSVHVFEHAARITEPDGCPRDDSKR